MDTVISKLVKITQNIPNNVAVVADGTCMTYAQLWNYANGFASYLRDIKVLPGENVLIKATLSVDFVISVIGCAIMGAIAIPVEKNMGSGAVCDIAERTDAAHYIGNEIIKNCRFTHISEVNILAEKYSDSDTHYELPDEENLAVILFTTGTTGNSKGVMLSHKALFAACDNNSFADRLDSDSRYLIATPLNHASGFRKLLSCLISGATAVLIDGFFNIVKFYRTIKDEKINMLVLPPSALRILLKMSSSELAKYSSQIKVIHIGSAALSEADKEKLTEILPNSRLLFGYGSTEAGNSAVYDFKLYPGLENCVGKPNLHTSIMVVDDDRKVITKRGKKGYLAVSGDTIMNGYYNDEKLTSQVMNGGILYTNDIGYIDRNGFIFVLGRKGDVINSGGLKISPVEIENVVMQYEKIIECACFGVPDKINGEVPKLCIVCDDKIDMTAFRKYLLDNLEYYKVPEKIEIMQQLPKLSNGKVDRKKLK